jgi:hypothetical protein
LWFFICCCVNPVLVRSFCFVCPILVRCLSRLGTVFVFLFRFAGLFQSNFSADSMTLASSTLQIRMHDYSRHLKFVISIVGFVIDIRPFYAINSDDVSLFAYSSLLVISEIEYIIILIDVFLMNLNEYCCFWVKKKVFKISLVFLDFE